MAVKCTFLLYLALILMLRIDAIPVKSLEKEEITHQRDESQQEEEETITDNINKANAGVKHSLFEGDIALSKADMEFVDTREDGDVDGELDPGRHKRNAVRNRMNLWHDRVIPYKFDSSIPAGYHTTVLEAMAEYHKHTCLKFVPRTNQENWLVFVYKDGCWSSVGKKYWRSDHAQEVSLGSGCNHKGTIMHELMHAIGFWHEQSRPDRNKYVEVLWENILDGQAHNFNKYDRGAIDTLQVPYDYDSIMHYGTDSFTKNSQPTLRSIKDPSRQLGQRNGFTQIDIQEINSLYECTGYGVSGWSGWSDFGPCSSSCHKYRQRFCASSNKDADCPGHSLGVEKQDVPCTQQECNAPVDGHWGRWSSWSSCSKSCDNGTQTRTRRCDDPFPENGGKSCVGDDKQQQACIIRRCGMGPDDCDFDYDAFCHWTNDPNNNDAFEWLRGSGATPSSSTGPSEDHTSGKGTYIYVESSSPAQDGYKARLLSKDFPATPGRCLSFYYHMYGESTGTLNVYVTDNTGNSMNVWTKSGDQGNKWIEGKVTIESKTDYKVVFEAVRASSFRGDIGLDDISFTNGPCIEEIGCFRDNKNQAFLKLVANLRSEIDWYHLEKTVQKCALLTKQSGFKVFGVQFYGECWSGESKLKYDSWGQVQDKSKGCPFGVGVGNVNAVYRVLA